MSVKEKLQQLGLNEDQLNVINEILTEQSTEHENTIKSLKVDHAVSTALTKAGAKNINVVKGALDFGKIKFNSNDEVEGLNDQIEQLRKSDSYLFGSSEPIANPIIAVAPTGGTIAATTKAKEWDTPDMII